MENNLQPRENYLERVEKLKTEHVDQWDWLKFLELIERGLRKIPEGQLPEFWEWVEEEIKNWNGLPENPLLGGNK